ncbi:MAG: hypothetical protein H0T94_12415 [Acidimicrobiia bacterium]|nr:hypothetical protein [Acidimicrobiia bacterium]MDQ3499670.1 hypothetical protein [Actinomycetota bacterium]
MNSRRAVLATLSGAALLLLGTVTLAAAVEANSSLTPHYQYLREAVVAGAVMISLGAVILLRRPRHSIGMILLVGGAMWFVQALLGELSVAASVFDWTGSSVTAWAANLIRQPGFLLSFALIFLLYPTGTPLGTWGRILIRLAVVGAVLFVLLLALAPGPLEDFPAQLNPFGTQLIDAVRQPLELAQVGLLLFGVFGGLITIAVRFRRSRGEERAQIKWFFYSTVVAILVLILANVLFPVEMEHELGAIVWLAAPLTILAAMGVAIVRYRLFDIDQLVSRTVTYGLVVALLAGAYAGVVFLLRAFLPLEGQVAVAGSTLLVAALFNPLRRRIQGVIDRRFNRSRYDVARTIEAFSQHLTEAVELVPLRSELSRLVAHTMQPVSLSVWLRES